MIRGGSTIRNTTRLVCSTRARHQTFATSAHARSGLQSQPAPPRLPKEEQEVYETLQKSSTGAFSTPNPTVIVNQPGNSSAATQQISSPSNEDPQTQPGTESAGATGNTLKAKVNADGKGEELHPDVRRGAKPEFEGDTNPKTGEVGGPKNDPLRWGGKVDWSYNGRVTDF